MINNTNDLRRYRNQTPLTLLDIACLLGEADTSALSRMESGARPPTLELILLYNILFGVPVIDLFPHQASNITKRIETNGETLIKKLKLSPELHRSYNRHQYLKSVITRLTDLEEYEG